LETGIVSFKQAFVGRGACNYVPVKYKENFDVSFLGRRERF
jgi:hypothetical protein